MPAEAAALALEPERGGVEEGDADPAEQLAPMGEQGLLDQLGAGPAVLVLGAEPGDRLVELAQADVLGTGDAAALRPGLGVTVRAGDHEAVQDGGVDGTLEVEGEAVVLGHAPQHRAAAGPLPEPAEDEVGADALAPQRRELALVEGGEDQGAAAVARRRDGELVEQARRLDLVAAAEGLDDALHVPAALAEVLDEVDVVVAVDALDADEHGAGLRT